MTDRELMLALMRLIGKDNIRARQILSERLCQPDWTIDYDFGDVDADSQVCATQWAESASSVIGLPA